jgi:hypothetical protein
MSTRTIALIFVILVVIAGALFFSGDTASQTEMPTGTTHTMPDGTVMHVMPDGSMMPN